MLVNTKSSSLQLSIILNKGTVKESAKRGGDVTITSMHNGSITAAHDTDKYFAQFRPFSDKQGEIPMFVQTGTKLKQIEQQISVKVFMDLFYGGNYIDTKFYVNLTEEICEAINDSSCKAIKFTFSSSSITERKDEEYQGNTISCFYIESVEVETLDSYFGIGRKVDNDHMIACIEQALELAVTKKSNTVTGEELKEKAEKLSKSSKKKLIREVEQAIVNSAQEGLLAEFKEAKFSSDVEELQEQLSSFKARATVTVKVEEAVKEEGGVSENRPLSSAETASFLMDLIS